MSSQDNFDKWIFVAELLNDRIRQDGETHKDDKLIWDPLLHKWNNSDWVQLMEAMHDLYAQYPQYFKQSDLSAMRDTIKVLVKGIETNKNRVMDRRDHKSLAWRMIHVAREVYNRANDIWLPNDQISKHTVKDILFELQ